MKMIFRQKTTSHRFVLTVAMNFSSILTIVAMHFAQGVSINQIWTQKILKVTKNLPEKEKK